MQVAERRHRLAIGAAEPRRLGCQLFIAQPKSACGLRTFVRRKMPVVPLEREYSTQTAPDFPLREGMVQTYRGVVNKETTMNAIPINETSRPVTWITRAAVVVVSLYVALAVGAPWLLYDAPPSAQDVLASKVYCAPGSVLAAPR